MKQQPKDLKTSIRNKYNRRLKRLSHEVEQYLILAEARLDKNRSGRIYKRAEIENIVEKCEELKELLPRFETPFFSEESIERILNQSSENTEKTLQEGKDFLDNLTEEDWKQLRKFANKE